MQESNIAPPDGNFQAYGDTKVGATNAGSLSTSLGLTAGNTLGDQIAGSGGTRRASAVWQTGLTLTAGDTISFFYNFLTQEPVGGENDTFFLMVGQQIISVASVSTSTFAPVTGSDGYTRATGYLAYSFVVTTSGTFNVGVGVTNVQNNAANRDSGFLVDNFVVQGAPPPVVPVPVPPTIYAGLFGALGFTARVLHRRRKAKS
jgi:hypothetical protein